MQRIAQSIIILWLYKSVSFTIRQKRYFTSYEGETKLGLNRCHKTGAKNFQSTEPCFMNTRTFFRYFHLINDILTANRQVLFQGTTNRPALLFCWKLYYILKLAFSLKLAFRSNGQALFPFLQFAGLQDASLATDKVLETADQEISELQYLCKESFVCLIRVCRETIARFVQC